MAISDPFGPTHAIDHHYDPQCAPGPAIGKPGRSAMRKRRLNLVAIVVSLLVPWLLFCVMTALLSFEPHYKRPILVYAAVCIFLLIVLWTGLTAFVAIQARSAGDMTRQPNWYCFIFVTGLIAWVLALRFGNWIFTNHTNAYYDIKNLNSYDSIDPSSTRGVQVMDGGGISFRVGTAVNTKLAMEFKNDKSYCVAPITFNDLPLESYDFWAVGLDCCTDKATAALDFKCHESAGRLAHAGLRMMRDEWRPFFRLAVQQAEAKHQLKATHPLFLYWVKDVNHEVDSYRYAGYFYFFAGLLSHFGLQFVLVVIAAGCFAQGGV